MYLKTSSAKWRPFCLDLNVLVVIYARNYICRNVPVEWVIKTLNMLSCFKNYGRYIHISYHILDFVQQKRTKFTVEQPYMLHILYCQYHICSSCRQGISSHGIDPQSRNILSRASEELMTGYTKIDRMCKRSFNSHIIITVAYGGLANIIHPYYVGHYDDVIMTMLASQITSLTVVYSIVYSGVNQRKHQSSASLAFVWEIHRGPVNFPHKWPVPRKMFPFDDVIMYCCCLIWSTDHLIRMT